MKYKFWMTNILLRWIFSSNATHILITFIHERRANSIKTSKAKYFIFTKLPLLPMLFYILNVYVHLFCVNSFAYLHTWVKNLMLFEKTKKNDENSWNVWDELRDREDYDVCSPNLVDERISYMLYLDSLFFALKNCA